MESDTTITVTSTDIVINIGGETSPRSPRLSEIRKPSPLTPEAMKRIKYLTANPEPIDTNKLSPISPQYPTSDLGSSPRSSISVITSGWSQFRDQKRSSSDFTDGDSDCCKDIFSPGITLSPSPFSPFSEPDIDAPYHFFAHSPSPCSYSSASSHPTTPRYRFTFDPSSPSYVKLSSSKSQFWLPSHISDSYSQNLAQSSSNASGSGPLERSRSESDSISNAAKHKTKYTTKVPRVSVVEVSSSASGDRRNDQSEGISDECYTECLVAPSTEAQGVKKRLLQRFLKSGVGDKEESYAAGVSDQTTTETEDRDTVATDRKSCIKIYKTLNEKLDSDKDSPEQLTITAADSAAGGLRLPVITDAATVNDSSRIKDTFPYSYNAENLVCAQNLFVRGRTPYKTTAIPPRSPVAPRQPLTQTKAYFEWWFQQQMTINNGLFYPPTGHTPSNLRDVQTAQHLSFANPLFTRPVHFLSAASSSSATTGSSAAFQSPSHTNSSTAGSVDPTHRFHQHHPHHHQHHTAHYNAYPYPLPLKARRSHSESDVAYLCRHCGQSFGLHDRLAKHIASRHRDRCSSTESSPKTHKCGVCHKTFGRSDMLTRHMRLHTGIKPYGCRICGQVFSRSDHLSTHQRTHTGEKPYQCPQCSYAASRRDMITRHMRTHAKGHNKCSHNGNDLSGHGNSDLLPICFDNPLDWTPLKIETSKDTYKATTSDAGDNEAMEERHEAVLRDKYNDNDACVSETEGVGIGAVGDSSSESSCETIINSSVIVIDSNLNSVINTDIHQLAGSISEIRVSQVNTDDSEMAQCDTS